MKGKLIYLLQDDADIRAQLGSLLSKERFEIICCNTVKDHTQQLSERISDLCIIDLTLPDGNGLDVLSTLHADP